jgi:hypothetical protein
MRQAIAKSVAPEEIVVVRYAVGTVLLFYFIGAQAIQPYVPPILDVATAGFHGYVNHGLKRAFGPTVKRIRGG